MIVNFFIYLLLGIFYALALRWNAPITLSSTALVFILFLLFKEWLKTKSRYIVSTPLFLFGIFFNFAWIYLIYHDLKTYGTVRADLLVRASPIFLLSGIPFLVIRKKLPGEKEAHSLAEMKVFEMEKDFQLALQKKWITYWEKVACRGPMFHDGGADYRIRKYKKDPHPWAYLEFTAKEKKLVLQATQTLVDLAEKGLKQFLEEYTLTDYYNQLGWMYEKGFGCEVSLELAAAYYQTALDPAQDPPLRPFHTDKALKRVLKKLNR